MIQLLVLGLVSILGQAVLLRELSVAFYGVDLIYTLALGIWLVWTAAGAVIAGRNLNPEPARVDLLLILFSVLLPADVVFIRAMRILFSGIPGAYLPFPDQMLAMAAALLPIGLLSGLMFQWAAKSFMTWGRSLAAAYAVESAGGCAGGLLATLLLRSGVQNFATATICACIAAGVVLAACPGGSRRLRAVSGCSLAILFVLLLLSGTVDRAMTSWTHPQVVASRDTPYSRITVTRQDGQLALYENDVLTYETEGTEAEEFAHMAALLHPHPARVLILGGGIEGTAGEILKHRPERVDCVEINSGLAQVAVPLLPAPLQQPLRDPAVRRIIDDPRQFLSRAGSYDLILIGMPEPDSGQTNRYYTLEFFRQCAARLEPDGILAFRLKSAENMWTPQQTARAVSIYRTLKTALPEVQVLPGGTNTFAASRQALAGDPLVLTARFRSRGIKARLVSEPYIRYVYGNSRFAWTAHTLETGDSQLNTDVRPICYQYTLMIWLTKFYPGLAAWSPASLASWSRFRRLAWWAAGLFLAVLFLFGRRRPPIRGALLAGVAGLLGMVLETLLVLHYQVRSGILYQDIGLLLMSFMAGLASGSLAVHHWMVTRVRRPAFWFVPALAVGFALLALIVGGRVRAVSSGGLMESAVLLLTTGALVSAAFAFAGFAGAGDGRKAVGRLYAADLIGGCLGSLAASLLLIPLAGSDVTAMLMVPPALLMALLANAGPAH